MIPMNNADKISNKYTVGDVVRSNTATRMGLKEQFTPPQSVIDSASYLAKTVLDGLPIPTIINSWYRSPKLNTAVKGARNSDHMTGSAVDLDTANDARNGEVFQYILKNCEFNQLIWEFGNDKNPSWVHVSCKPTGNKREVLVAYKDPQNRTRYKPYKP